MFINSMSEFVDYLSEVSESNHVNGTMRDIDASASWIMARVDVFGGTTIFHCIDYGKDSVVLFSEVKHAPDTIAQNAYCVAYVTSDGYLASFEKGTFDECFSCLVEWARTEVADVA